MGVRRQYLVSMYLQSSTLWGKHKEIIKKVKNLLWSSIECAVTFRMTEIPIPRQVIDGDPVQADSRCTCIFQSSCEWYFINFVGKFGNLIGYAIWAAAVNHLVQIICVQENASSDLLYCIKCILKGQSFVLPLFKERMADLYFIVLPEVSKVGMFLLGICLSSIHLSIVL